MPLRQTSSAPRYSDRTRDSERLPRTESSGWRDDVRKASDVSNTRCMQIRLPYTMLASLLFSTLLTAQLPPKSTVMYTGIPMAEGSSSVRMVTHDAKAELSKERVTLSSVTFFKNRMGSDQKVTLMIPFEGHNIAGDMPRLSSLTATWDNQPMQLRRKGAQRTGVDDEQQRASGVWAETYADYYMADVTFKAGEAHGLRVNFSTPIGKAGLDGAQRTVAYDTTGATSWGAPIEQFNLSLRYSPRIVFQIFAALPPRSWQTGPNGAFIKRLNFSSDERPLFLFTYYPGGFDKIGG